MDPSLYKYVPIVGLIFVASIVGLILWFIRPKQAMTITGVASVVRPSERPEPVKEAPKPVGYTSTSIVENKPFRDWPPAEAHDVAQTTLNTASEAIKTAADVHKPDAPDHIKEASKSLASAATKVLEAIPHAVEAVKAKLQGKG